VQNTNCFTTREPRPLTAAACRVTTVHLPHSAPDRRWKLAVERWTFAYNQLPNQPNPTASSFPLLPSVNPSQHFVTFRNIPRRTPCQRKCNPPFLCGEATVCLPFVLIRAIRVSGRSPIHQHSSSEVITCLNLSSFVLTFSSKKISLAPSPSAPTHCHIGCCKHFHSRFFRTPEVPVTRAISVIPVHSTLSFASNFLPILVPLCGHNIRVHLPPSVAKIVSPELSPNNAKFHLLTPTNTFKKVPITHLNLRKPHTSLRLRTSNTPKTRTFLHTHLFRIKSAFIRVHLWFTPSRLRVVGRLSERTRETFLAKFASKGYELQ
jgi:hypothetical protein